tara:strand:- start:675 stop:869 length:195 start_codon:yes stop_codon:yes gene_type:complete
MMISEKFDKANAKIRKQKSKDNALEKAKELNITMCDFLEVTFKNSELTKKDRKQIIKQLLQYFG